MRCWLCPGHLMLLGKIGQTKRYRCCGMIFFLVALQSKPPAAERDKATEENKDDKGAKTAQSRKS